ncbi:MAG: ImuA family protein [Hyphomicrobiaceae bacterium]
MSQPQRLNRAAGGAVPRAASAPPPSEALSAAGELIPASAVVPASGGLARNIRLAALEVLLAARPPGHRAAGKAALVRGCDLGGTVAVPTRKPAAGGSSSQAGWGTGAEGLDDLLGTGGLAMGGVHEIKPVLSAGGIHAADSAAAVLFLLMLARRRLSLQPLSPQAATDAAALVWCARRSDAREFGALYAPGLAALGLDPRRVVLVEPAGRDEVLWAVEEALVSQAAHLVVGVVDGIASTPARRLSLAAERAGTGCLLLSGPRAPAAPATATRWRVGCAPGAPHPFAPRAPGALRLAVTLERCRSRPLAGAAQTFTLEWSDETHRFHMAAPLADRTNGADTADARARRRYVA